MSAFDYTHRTSLVRSLPASQGLAPTIARPTNMNPLWNGILSYWKLDEVSGDRYDSTGNGYTLYQPNSADTVILSVSGVRGNAVTFTTQTTASYLYNEDIQVAGDYSISAWFKVNGASLQNAEIPQAIWGTGTPLSGDSTLFYAYVSSDNNHLFFSYYDAQNGGENLTLTPSLSTWYSSVVTHSAALSTTNIYIDSSLVYSLTGTGSADFTGFSLSEFVFANGSEHGQYEFNGAIDEVGIWNRTLTQADVNKLARKFTPPF